MTIGYQATAIIQEFMLAVGDGHQLAVTEAGNPNGIPVLFLHGGPGGRITEKALWFFKPEVYRIILFDQRGTGRSQPHLSLQNNTPAASVSDIEQIRQKLHIDSWLVFGGSYGSTLALLYAIKYPERVRQLILRGIFLGRQSDIAWLFEGGTGQFYPQEFRRFQELIPADQRTNLVAAYYQRMLSDTQAIRDEAMKSWSDWESGLVTLQPNFTYGEVITDDDRSLALLEAHYFANGLFWSSDNYILEEIQRIQQVPLTIVHGRYDIDCRPSGAFELAEAHASAKLFIIEEGAHSPYEAEMFTKLVEIMDELAENLS